MGRPKKGFGKLIGIMGGKVQLLFVLKMNGKMEVNLLRLVENIKFYLIGLYQIIQNIITLLTKRITLKY